MGTFTGSTNTKKSEAKKIVNKYNITNITLPKESNSDSSKTITVTNSFVPRVTGNTKESVAVASLGANHPELISAVNKNLIAYNKATQQNMTNSFVYDDYLSGTKFTKEQANKYGLKTTKIDPGFKDNSFLAGYTKNNRINIKAKVDASVQKYFEDHVLESNDNSPFITPFTNQHNEPLKELVKLALSTQHYASADKETIKQNTHNFFDAVLNMFYRPRYFNKQQQAYNNNIYRGMLKIEDGYGADNDVHQTYFYDEENHILYQCTLHYSDSSHTKFTKDFNVSMVQNPKIMPKSYLKIDPEDTEFENLYKDIFEGALEFTKNNDDVCFDSETLLNTIANKSDLTDENFSLADLNYSDPSQNLGVQKLLSKSLTTPATATLINIIISGGITIDRFGSAARALFLENQKLLGQPLDPGYVAGSGMDFYRNRSGQSLYEQRANAKAKWTMERVAKTLKEGFTYTYKVPKFNNKNKITFSKNKYQDTSFINYFKNLPSNYSNTIYYKHPNIMGFAFDLITDPGFFMSIGSTVLAKTTERGLSRNIYEHITKGLLDKSEVLLNLNKKSVKRTSKQIASAFSDTHLSDDIRALKIKNALIQANISADIADGFIEAINKERDRAIRRLSSEIAVTTEYKVIQSIDNVISTKKLSNTLNAIDDAWAKAVFTGVGVYPALRYGFKTYKTIKNINAAGIIRTSKNIADYTEARIFETIRKKETKELVREILKEQGVSPAETYLKCLDALRDDKIASGIITEETDALLQKEAAALVRSQFDKITHKLQIVLLDSKTGSQITELQKLKENILEVLKEVTSIKDFKNFDELKNLLKQEYELFCEQALTETNSILNINSYQRTIDNLIELYQNLTDQIFVNYLENWFKDIIYINYKYNPKVSKKFALKKVVKQFDELFANDYIVIDSKMISILDEMSIMLEETSNNTKLLKSLDELLNTPVKYISNEKDLIDKNKIYYSLDKELYYIPTKSFKQALEKSIKRVYSIKSKKISKTNQQIIDDIVFNFKTKNSVTTYRQFYKLLEAETASKFRTVIDSATIKPASETVLKEVEDAVIVGLKNDIKNMLKESEKDEIDLINDRDILEFINLTEEELELLSKYEDQLSIVTDIIINRFAETILEDISTSNKIPSIYQYAPGLNEHKIEFLDSTKAAIKTYLATKKNKILEVSLNDRLYTIHVNYAFENKLILKGFEDLINTLSRGVSVNDIDPASDAVFQLSLLLQDPNVIVSGETLTKAAKALTETNHFINKINLVFQTDPKKADVVTDIIYNFNNKTPNDFLTDASLKEVFKRKLQSQLVVRNSNVYNNDMFRNELLAGKLNQKLRNAGVSQEDIEKICSGGHGAEYDVILTMLRTRLKTPELALELDQYVRDGGKVFVYDTETFGTQITSDIYELGAVFWKPLNIKSKKYTKAQLKAIIKDCVQRLDNKDYIISNRTFSEKEINAGVHPDIAFINKVYGSLDNWKIKYHAKGDKELINSNTMCDNFKNAIGAIIGDSSDVKIIGYNNHSFDDVLLEKNYSLKRYINDFKTIDLYEEELKKQGLLWSEDELAEVLKYFKDYVENLARLIGYDETFNIINPQKFLNAFTEVLRDLNKIGQSNLAETLAQQFDLNLDELLGAFHIEKNKLNTAVTVRDFYSTCDNPSKQQVFKNFVTSMNFKEFKDEAEIEKFIKDALSDEGNEYTNLFKEISALDDINEQLVHCTNADNFLEYAPISFREPGQKITVDYIENLRVLIGGQFDNPMRRINLFNKDFESIQYLGSRRLTCPLQYTLFKETIKVTEYTKKSLTDIFKIANAIDRKRDHISIPFTTLNDIIIEDPDMFKNIFNKLIDSISKSDKVDEALYYIKNINFESQDLMTQVAAIQYVFQKYYYPEILNKVNISRDLLEPELLSLFRNDIDINHISQYDFIKCLDSITNSLNVKEQTILQQLIQTKNKTFIDTTHLESFMSTSYYADTVLDQCLSDIKKFEFLNEYLANIINTKESKAVPFESADMYMQQVATHEVYSLVNFLKKSEIGYRVRFSKGFTKALNALDSKAVKKFFDDILHTKSIVGAEDKIISELTANNNPGFLIFGYTNNDKAIIDTVLTKLKSSSRIKVLDDKANKQLIFVLKNTDENIVKITNPFESSNIDISNYFNKNETQEYSEVFEKYILKNERFDIHGALIKAYQNNNLLSENILGNTNRGLISYETAIDAIKKYLVKFYDSEEEMFKDIILFQNKSDDNLLNPDIACNFIHTVSPEATVQITAIYNGNNPLIDLSRTLKKLSMENQDRTSTICYFLGNQDLLSVHHLIEDCKFNQDELLTIIQKNDDLVPCALIEDRDNVVIFQQLKSQKETLEDRLKKLPIDSKERNNVLIELNKIKKELNNLSTIKVQRFDINNSKDLEFALQHNVMLVPVQVYETAFDDLNYFSAKPLVKFIKGYMNIMKASYLIRISTSLKNYIDENVKTINDVGFENLPAVVRNNFIAIRDYITYEKMMKYIRKDAGKYIVSNYEIAKNFKHYQRTIPEFNELSKKLPYVEFTILDSFMNYGASGGGMASLIRSQALTKASKRIDYKPGNNFFENTQSFFKDKGFTQFTDLKNYGEYLRDTMVSAPLIPLQFGEVITRYTHHLTLREQGIFGSKAFNRVSRTHFNYGLKSKTDIYAELVIPFYTYIKMNSEYWCSEILKDPSILREITRYENALLRPEISEVNDAYAEDRYINMFGINNLLAGNIPVRIPGITNIESQRVFLKLNPSIMDALALFMDPVNQGLRKVFTPLQLGLEKSHIFENLIEQGLYEVPYATNGWKCLIPYLGSIWEPTRASVQSIINRTFTDKREAYENTLLAKLVNMPWVRLQIPGLFAFEHLDLTREDIQHLYEDSGYIWDYVDGVYKKLDDPDLKAKNVAEAEVWYLKHNIDIDLLTGKIVPVGFGYYSRKDNFYWEEQRQKAINNFGVDFDYVRKKWVPLDTVGAIFDYEEFKKYQEARGYALEYYTDDFEAKWVPKDQVIADSYAKAAELYRTKGYVYDYISKSYKPAASPNIATTKQQAAAYFATLGYVYDYARGVYVRQENVLIDNWADYQKYQSAKSLEYDYSTRTWVPKGTATISTNLEYKTYNSFEEKAAAMRLMGLGWNSITKEWVDLDKLPKFNEYQQYMESQGYDWDYIQHCWKPQGQAEGRSWQDYYNYCKLHNVEWDYDNKRYIGSYKYSKDNKKAASAIFKSKPSRNFTTNKNTYIYSAIHKYINRDMPYARVNVRTMPTLNLCQIYPVRYNRVGSRIRAARFLSNYYK